MNAARWRIESFAPTDERRATFDSLAAAPGAAPERLAAGARCMLAWSGNRPVARLSYKTAMGLHGASGVSGIIGHYEALDGAAGIALLEHARQLLAEAGAERVIGPMNGSTWGRYRLALPPAPENTAEPPFLTEPCNPPEYPAHFLAAGFSVVASYESAIARDLEIAHPRREEMERVLGDRGVHVRPLDPERFDEELAAIFGLSERAFADNPFYTPIPFSSFRAMYEPIRPLLDPELVRLAQDAEGQLVGFVFAFPDLPPLPRPLPHEGRGGNGSALAPLGRVVLKTLATAPEMRGLGLGAYLTDEVRRLAYQKGYQAVIHALMHVANDSKKISRHTASIFRRYALYQWAP